MTKAAILIVEDNAIISIHLQEILASWGYRTLSAASGEQALEEISQSLPDLVLLDICLKGALDGIQVAEKIMDKYQTPTIFLSAYADEELLRRAKLTGPYGYLVKPVHERELVSIVEMALYKHSMDHCLRESEEKFRTLVETSSAAILILQDNRCLYANLEGLQQNGRRSLCIRTRQGEKRWVEIVITGMVYQGKPAVVVTANDITDRRNAERARALGGDVDFCGKSGSGISVQARFPFIGG